MTVTTYPEALSQLPNNDLFFVVIGAMDGINHDQLYPYAFKNKNWKGMLVEPIPIYFEKLKTNYENRDNLIFKNVAITDKQETKNIYTIPRQHIENGLVPSWCDGISTFKTEQSAISYDGIKDKITTEPVVCCPFKDLIDEHKITNIDILQIDAEGYDFEIFNQIWQLGFRPKIIYIEIVQLNQKQIDFLYYVLENTNYNVLRECDNLFCIQKEPVVTHFPKRKRVAFYAETQWAFGSIYSSLAKELYKYNIDADIIDWSIGFSYEEWKQFDKLYDIFVTIPGNPSSVLADVAGIPYEKIIAIAHAKVDLVDSITYKNKYDAFLNCACITPYLQQVAKDLGITRQFHLLRNGINFDKFYQPISESLKTLGYAGAIKFYFEDCKRSYLAQQLANSVGMNLKFAVSNGEKKHYKFMPSFYSEVDAVVISTNEAEACGLPIMETAAAGRLPISARVGIARDIVHPPGIIVPVADKDFLATAKENILELQKNSVKFRQLCAEAQAFAYDHYDWRHVVPLWANVINNV